MLTLKVKRKVNGHNVAYTSKSEPIHLVVPLFKVLWNGPSIGAVTFDLEVKVIQCMLINVSTNCVFNILEMIFSLQCCLFLKAQMVA